MKIVNTNDLSLVRGGVLDGCTVPSMNDMASAYGVGAATGVTIGGATGRSSAANRGGIILTALVGAFLGGFTIGVAINHLAGQCEA